VIYHAASAGLLPIEYDMADDGHRQYAPRMVGPTFTRRHPAATLHRRSHRRRHRRQFHEQSSTAASNPAPVSPTMHNRVPRSIAPPGDSFANEPLPSAAMSTSALTQHCRSFQEPSPVCARDQPQRRRALPQKTHFNIRWRSDGFAGMSASHIPPPDLPARSPTSSPPPKRRHLRMDRRSPRLQRLRPVVLKISSVGTPAIFDTNDVVSVSSPRSPTTTSTTTRRWR